MNQYQVIVLAIILVFVGLLYLVSRMVKKNRDSLPYIEVGKNYNLTFPEEVKADIFEVKFDPNTADVMLSIAAGYSLAIPKIYYWYFVNSKGEKKGMSFLIKDIGPNGYQYLFEMNGTEIVNVENAIIEKTDKTNYEEAVVSYFAKISRNVKNINSQFEDLLVIKNIQYEKMTGKNDNN